MNDGVGHLIGAGVAVGSDVLAIDGDVSVAAAAVVAWVRDQSELDGFSAYDRGRAGVVCAVGLAEARRGDRGRGEDEVDAVIVGRESVGRLNRIADDVRDVPRVDGPMPR